MSGKVTREQLNEFSKENLIDVILDMQIQHEQEMTFLTEQLSALSKNQFGRKTEKAEKNEYQGQLSLQFNEAESVYDPGTKEPEFETICPKSYVRKKRSGKREEDLEGLPVIVLPAHELDEAELKETFPKGYTRLPDEVYKKLNYIPAVFEIEEHHIAVYQGNDQDGNRIFARGKHPYEVLDKSIITPSLAACIMNAKYVNSIPLYRLEKEFERMGIHLSRQVMASWVIRCAERYFSLITDRMHEHLLQSKVLHADETPVLVNKDGRKAGVKSYMWVYRTGRNEEKEIVLYDYQKTRKADHPKEYLKEYGGWLVCDGYQVYHQIAEKEEQKLGVGGCWIHGVRRFKEAVSAASKTGSGNTIAKEAVTRMTEIMNLDNQLDNLSKEERLQKRQEEIKKKVDDFFQWIKGKKMSVAPKSKTGEGITYCLNQEKYLRSFLEDGDLPMDNNRAEQAIRNFVIGKKNWMMCDTIYGAKASAVLYSLVETAKANQLKPYEYLKYLLEVLPEKVQQKNQSFIDDLMPWSEKLPGTCKSLKG